MSEFDSSRSLRCDGFIEDFSCCHHFYHKCITGATGDTGATGATGPAFLSYLNGTKTVSQIDIPVGGIAKYDTVNIVGPDFSYDPGTGLFTIINAGVYVLDWKFSVTPNAGTISIQIDLDKFPGPVFINGISITATNPVLNGSNIVYAAAAGDVLGFVNTSSGPIGILLIALSGPIGSISIHRIA